jgi:hypothetical protein
MRGEEQCCWYAVLRHWSVQPAGQADVQRSRLSANDAAVDNLGLEKGSTCRSLGGEMFEN